MRGLLLLCLLSIPFCAIAALDAPQPVYLSHSQDVLLAKVKSTNGDAIEFSITEVLKGKSHSPLILRPTSGMGEVFKSGEEYILCWMGENSTKGVVCSSMFFGIPEWRCISVSRDGEKITVSGIGSLEKAKEICAQKPAPLK